VTERLSAAARGGLHDGDDNVENLRMPARWLVAGAYERLGRADSAAVYLGLMLEPPGYGHIELIGRGLAETRVRERLVAVDLRAGRIGEARRQWDILSASCIRPDPEAQAQLDETRAALMAAEGLGAAGRK
jgi:hypothetical protein